MTIRRLRPVPLILAIVGLLLPLSGVWADDGTPGPVLLELFTSQGCSSCPPAERLFRSIVRGEELDELDVVGVAWHVDYWNRLGWEDPFSSPRFSELQRWYAERLPAGRVYTPMAVIQGRSHEVGSNREAVALKLRRAASSSEPLTASAVEGSDRTVISWRTPRDRRLELVVARTRSGLETEVLAGENRGRRLEQDRVGRELEVVDVRSGSREVEVRSDIASGAEDDPRDRRVLWLRDPRTGEVLAVGRWPGGA